MKIGLIGTGLMGLPMGKNLIKKFDLCVYNRTKEKANDLIELGAKIKDSPSEIANQSDVVIIMVTDDKACDQIFNGEGGVLKTTNTNLIIINMSTISPKKAKFLEEGCKKRSLLYSEAPVAGTVGPAIQGTLKIFFGGSKDILERVKPILETMGDKIFYIGEVGQASIVKLLVNINLAVQMSILSETLSTAESQGINPNDFLNIVNNTGISTVLSKFKGPNMIQGTFSPAFPFEHLLKDLKYGLSLGSDELLPLTKTTKELFEKGLLKEKGKDFSAIYDYYKSQIP
jgi:3-hydroxyisobutyrate dehydrogenase